MGRTAIVSASLGAGHDGAAQEIADRLRGNGYDVTGMDLLDLLPWRLGRWVRSSYRQQLAVVPRTWEWLLTALERNQAWRPTAAEPGSRTMAIWAGYEAGHQRSMAEF